MKVAGFSIVRNAIKYDYPIVEAISSILPVCDIIVIAVGKSEDDTLNLIKNIASPKIKIIETIWDDSLRKGGQVLALETNKAFDAIPKEVDWCFYIQADEVLHEKYIPSLKASMQKQLNKPDVEGLLFDYQHFYGSYDFVGDSRKWYRKEIRVIRNDKQIRSYRDAQGFRKNNRKLFVKTANATMYHYGWVKHPEKQQLKRKEFHKLWHSDEWVKQNISVADSFDYSQIDALKRFENTHPQTMQARIAQKNWSFDFDPSQKQFSFKNKILRKFEKLTGYRIGEYKNYVLLK